MSEFDSRLTDKHVVILINYMRKHHVLAFKAFAERVGKLTVLVSTDMESDRSWIPDWSDLDVVIQKNLTFTLKRSSGFDERNFIHIPWDTYFQLNKLKPDVVVSYEMGARTLLSVLFRRMKRNTPLVMVGNMSRYIESQRGRLRNGVRNLIRKSVDLATYNGPGCKKYLQSIGFEESKLMYFPYCFDPDKTFAGPKHFDKAGVKNVLFCGSLSERKAILPFSIALKKYCEQNPNRRITFTVAGDGPLRDKVVELDAPNLELKLLGNCSNKQMRDCYRDADVCAFPSFGDEWGLVPIEAWASGVPVLGSKYAQSVEANCRHGVNGWVFDPRDPVSISQALNDSLSASGQQLTIMSEQSRELVKSYSAESSARHLCRIVGQALDVVGSRRAEHQRPANRILSGQKTSARPNPLSTRPRPVATLSLDLDNKWSYLKSHNDPNWEAHPGYFGTVVPRILSALDELEIKITFFVVGQDAVIRENADALKMITDRGHEIGNHSFHHETCLHLYTPGQLEQELQMAEEAIKRVTGQHTIGFRGPGFSLSDQTLNILVRRGYKYDCTMFPTYLSPLARTYHFMSGSFTRKQVQEKKALFGKFSDGFMPNSPYLWQTEYGDLLEIPVTTFPGIKTPIHATYLHYLATFSPWSASTYLDAALRASRWGNIAPSLLLHPLDFLGVDDEPDLKFFPGMNVDSKTKLLRIRKYLRMYHESFEVVTMQQFASMALGGQLSRRSSGLARTGIT